MLAVIKLGAVIMPTTAALGPADLRDRVDRGGARVVVANAADAAKFDEVPRRLPARRAWATADGWHAYADAYAVAAGTRSRPPPPRRTRCSSTSPPARPASRNSSSTPRSPTRSGTCRRCTGSARDPATCTSPSARPGWAKHAWSCFFAPWIAEATIFVYNYARFDAARAAGPDPAGRGHDVLRAADGVADADPGRPQRRQRGAARAARRRRAAQPRGHQPGRSAPGA